MLALFLDLSLWKIVLFLFSAIITIASIRLSTCLPQYRQGSSMKSQKHKKISVMVYWGSGGHTTEMIRLISNLRRDKYSPVWFVKSHSDSTSENKITAAKQLSQLQHSWHTVYRSREVKQSWFSTVITSFYCLIDCFLLVLKHKPQLILCNGPGTSVLICYCAFILRLIGVYHPVIVFVESFCRVESLSLSGRLIYHIADKFIVQWPQLASKHGRAEYLGRIC
jgi:beta-1,4-N-acetylglucosaminyltransferase